MPIEDLDQISKMKATRSADEADDRLRFIRKVLGIVAVQLYITTAITLIPTLNPNAAVWILAHKGWFWFALILMLTTNLAIICAPNVAREVPTNYLLLLAFTAAESYLVAYTSSLYQPGSVLMAAFLAASVVLGLTIYALTTKRDFSMSGGSLFIFGIAISICSLVLLFVPDSPFWTVVYSGASVILFGFYLIYDVQIIVGGGRYEIDMDDYVIGALIVYMDIIMLFLHILKLIGEKK